MEIIQKELARRLPYEPGFRTIPADENSWVTPVFELAGIKTRGENHAKTYFVAGIHERDSSLSLKCAKNDKLEEIDGIWIFREPCFIAEEDILEYFQLGRGFDIQKITEVTKKYMQKYLERRTGNLIPTV
jgi:hypothetical protein